MHEIKPSEIQFDEKGQIFSIQFDDKYFCQENGLKESQHVFLNGNALEKRWKRLPADKPDTFTIGETGFGTGLNFLSEAEYRSLVLLINPAPRSGMCSHRELV